MLFVPGRWQPNGLKSNQGTSKRQKQGISWQRSKIEQQFAIGWEIVEMVAKPGLAPRGITWWYHKLPTEHCRLPAPGWGWMGVLTSWSVCGDLAGNFALASVPRGCGDIGALTELGQPLHRGRCLCKCANGESKVPQEEVCVTWKGHVCAVRLCERVHVLRVQRSVTERSLEMYKVY